MRIISATLLIVAAILTREYLAISLVCAFVAGATIAVEIDARDRRAQQH